MFFEISNTPENVSKKKLEIKDEDAVLKLAPFCPTPIVTFENVPVNVESTKTLKILNPKLEGNQVLITKRPDELDLKLSWYEKYIEPNDSATLILSWFPKNPISQRFILQICDKRKIKYDIVIVCKSIVKKNNIQKINKCKSKPIGVGKKSPLRSNFKTKIKPNLIIDAFNKKENTLNVNTDFTYNCISNTSILFNLPHNEESSNTRRETYLITKETKSDYDTFLVKSSKENISLDVETPRNTLKTKKNRHHAEIGILSSIENFQFSPLQIRNNFAKRNLNDNHHYIEEKCFSKSFHDKKSYVNTFDEIDKKTLSPTIINSLKFSIQTPEISQIEICDVNKYRSSFENEINHINLDITHPIIEIIDDSGITKIDQDDFEGFQVNKITATTISDYQIGIQTPFNKVLDQYDNPMIFNPKRCSTEKKSLGNSSDKDLSFGNFNKGSETFIKADSPIIPLNPNRDMHSSPYSIDKSLIDLPVEVVDKHVYPKTLFSDNSQNFNERSNLRNSIKEKNDGSAVKSVIEADLWTKSPPSNPTYLQTIVEEPSITYSEVSSFDTNRKFHSEIFVLDKTYDTKNPPKRNVDSSSRKMWNKTAVNKDHVIRKMVELSNENKNRIIDDKSCHTLDIYAVATTIDPFLATTCLYDKDAFDRLENEFKQWLNYLLTPPSDLDTKLDIDVGKVWIENRNKIIPAAPTKEQVSSKYHTSNRLESLRKSAKILIKTPEITMVFLKVTSQIERKLLSIRIDKNLHLDIGLQKYVLSLLLCYNPLWLRIGLEAMYDKPISLTSNDDFGGLSDFITDHMFRDPYVSQKHLLLQPSYAENVKKFTLKKFLFLVFFLDQAKKNKIIFHDPCLFCRNAPFKESRQILFQFAKELLSGIGDITKHLKPTGYIVSHKQTPLNEFKYAVHNLATDLKDGIRLTRLMEIILLKENLTLGLRMPAISRLQKIHNVQIALSALQSTNFKIVGDITARDVVDGHREKTLSLLWQLIHKFRAPLFEKASITIQRWWKPKYFKISIKNRIQQKKNQKIHNATLTIQTWWRNIQRRKYDLLKLSVQTQACTIIQKNWRMWKCRSTFNNLKTSTINLQRIYRNSVLVRNAKSYLDYLRKNRAAIKIQQWFRKTKIRKILKSENHDRKYFLQLKSSVLKIQNLYRAKLLMEKERETFIKIQINTIKIQKFYRSYIKTRIIRQQYLILKSSTIAIQNRFRANVCMKICRNTYQTKRNSALIIQKYYRNYLNMKKCRKEYLMTRNAIISIQKFYKNRLLTINMRKLFLKQKQSAIVIQRYYKLYFTMKEVRNNYVLKKNAAILIQQKFRSHILMKHQREEFLTLKNATIMIQRHYSAKKLMQKHKSHYNNQRNAAIIIQRKFRSYLVMKQVRRKYLSLKKATITIQRYFIAKKLMQKHKLQYNSQRKAAVIIQGHLRSYLLMKQSQKRFLSLKKAATTIQRCYRAKKLMQKEKSLYYNKKNAAIIIQKRFKGYILMKYERNKFLTLKTAATKIQRYYTSYILTKQIRLQYLREKQLIILIQRRFRFNQMLKKRKFIQDSTLKIQQWLRSIWLTRKIKRDYLLLRTTTIHIQMLYRSKKLMKTEQESFKILRSTCIFIQRKYRAKKKMQVLRSNFLKMKWAATILQNCYRANRLMKHEKQKYLLLKQNVLFIQTAYRNKKLTLNTKLKYARVRSACILIQKKYRALKEMKIAREKYLQYKRNAIIIQKYFKSYRLMKIEREAFLEKKKSVMIIQKYFRTHILQKKEKNNACIVIQRFYRAYVYKKQERLNFLKILEATIKIQRFYRSYIQMKNTKHEYLKIRNATIVIQQFYRNQKIVHIQRRAFMNTVKIIKLVQLKYRSKLLSRKYRNDYLLQKNSAIIIQNAFRSYLLMKVERKKYLDLLKYTKIIQCLFRNKLLAKYQKAQFLNIRKAILKIQSYYKMYICRKKYLIMKNSAVIIQKYYRNFLLMKNTKLEYCFMKACTITLQKTVRKWIIQKKYIALRCATVQIQRKYREILKRKQKEQQISAAIKIQALWRAYSIRQEYLKLKQCVIFCQNRRRALVQMRENQKSYQSLCKCILHFQALARGYLCRQNITAKKLNIQNISALRKQIKAILKIQAYWRGYNIRKKQDDNSSVKKLRLRWQKGALQSTQLTIAERNNDALDVLCHFNDVASVIRAFKTLDFVTDVYPMMYNTDQTAGSISKRLILYMKTANRSVSTLETLQLGAAILINLTRYGPTAHFVYNTDCVDTIITLMMRWCGKDHTLSCSFCTLLWLFGKYKDIRENLSPLLQNTHYYKKLCHVRNSIVREQRMNSNKRYSQTPIKSAKLNQSFLKNSVYHNVNLPMTEPDFSIKRSFKPKIFQDEVFAINSVFNKFNLPLNN